MARSTRHNRRARPLYYVVPSDQVMALHQACEPGEAEEHLGPLGEDMPETRPPRAGFYTPGQPARKPAATTRGFFMDRYIY